MRRGDAWVGEAEAAAGEGEASKHHLSGGERCIWVQGGQGGQVGEEPFEGCGDGADWIAKARRVGGAGEAVAGKWYDVLCWGDGLSESVLRRRQHLSTDVEMVVWLKEAPSSDEVGVMVRHLAWLKDMNGRCCWAWATAEVAS